MNNKQQIFQLIICSVLLSSGVGMLVAGIAIPPLGVIDNSILIAFGEILTFVGSILGIDYHYKAKQASKE